MHNVTPNSIENLIEEYAELFSSTLDTVKGPPVVLHIGGSVPLIQRSARRVPLALGFELERLVEQDILEPVQHTAWITPIVLVIKDDGSMRICGKCTVNKALQKVLYQVSAVNDILATLKKGRIFAKLDLTRAYQQLLVDEASAELQTIITHNRTFKSWSYRMACYKAFDLLRTSFT
ncbi:conserved hypothetical protein [Trichinella spiralis]|uniref:hypothetical protein n=1 Tax=Trichinella spiralis TaxID=6334 RepID=UPI0001EFDC35|nr:conserved hypothetical protein [Trichinella spiralis]